MNGGRTCSRFSRASICAEIVFRIDAEQIGDVAVKAVEEVEAARIHALFHHVGVFVAHLREAVNNVFGERVFVGLEDETQLGAFKRDVLKSALCARW